MPIENKISRVIATSVIHEYAVMDLDSTVIKELRDRARKSVGAARHLQNFFLKDPSIPIETRNLMKQELLGDKFVLMLETLDLLLPLSTESIIEINQAVKAAISESENIQP